VKPNPQVSKHGSSAKAGAESDGKPKTRFWILLLVIFVGVPADLISKGLFFAPYLNARRTVVPGLIDFSSMKNTGGVFGVGQGRGLLLVPLSFAALYLLVRHYAASDRTRVIPNLATGLIFAGALGNLYDRVAYNYVRDFIHMHLFSLDFWPWVYNVADAFICFGVVLLAVDIIRGHSEPEADGKGTDADVAAEPKKTQRRRG